MVVRGMISDTDFDEQDLIRKSYDELYDKDSDALKNIKESKIIMESRKKQILKVRPGYENQI